MKMKLNDDRKNYKKEVHDCGDGLHYRTHEHWEDETYEYDFVWDVDSGVQVRYKKWDKCSFKDKLLLKWFIGEILEGE